SWKSNWFTPSRSGVRSPQAALNQAGHEGYLTRVACFSLFILLPASGIFPTRLTVRARDVVGGVPRLDRGAHYRGLARLCVRGWRAANKTVRLCALLRLHPRLKFQPGALTPRKCP